MTIKINAQMDEVKVLISFFTFLDITELKKKSGKNSLYAEEMAHLNGGGGGGCGDGGGGMGGGSGGWGGEGGLYYSILIGLRN